MDYEKKYKELVGEIRKAYLYAQTDSTKAVLEDIFPELAESQDKKVRKALIDFFGKGAKYGGQTNGVYDKDILAWLEKQGQVKESTISQHENRTCEENGNSLTYEDERIRKALLELVHDTTGDELYACYNVRKEEALAWIEKQESIGEDAIEREVKEDAGGYPYIDATELYDYENDKPLAKAGDRVKVVFIKDK